MAALPTFDESSRLLISRRSDMANTGSVAIIATRARRTIDGSARGDLFELPGGLAIGLACRHQLAEAHEKPAALPRTAGFISQ